ncbi:MAG: hypothetical protein JWN89_250 [Parcubacteria group bacterium]|nr:hypothetical protein [Parcubacteria group bacterium]
MEDLRVGQSGKVTPLPLDTAKEKACKALREDLSKVMRRPLFKASELGHLFTKETVALLQAAENMRADFGHAAVSGELILRAILLSPTARPRDILVGLGAKPQELLHKLSRVLHEAKHMRGPSSYLYLWVAREMIIASFSEAYRMGTSVHPEHLLLGVLHHQSRCYARLYLIENLRWSSRPSGALDEVRDKICKISFPALAS